VLGLRGVVVVWCVVVGGGDGEGEGSTGQGGAVLQVLLAGWIRLLAQQVACATGEPAERASSSAARQRAGAPAHQAVEVLDLLHRRLDRLAQLGLGVERVHVGAGHLQAGSMEWPVGNSRGGRRLPTGAWAPARCIKSWRHWCSRASRARAPRTTHLVVLLGQQADKLLLLLPPHIGKREVSEQQPRWDGASSP
jgi:hypothetical protein